MFGWFERLIGLDNIGEIIKDEEITQPLACDFFFNIDEFPIISLEYDNETKELEVIYLIGDEQNIVISYCSYETYESHLKRLKDKIKSQTGE